MRHATAALRRLGPGAGLALLLAGCTLPPPPANAGVRAIDAGRAAADPDYQSPGTDNTGTWGGMQMPNISTAPRFEVPQAPGATRR